MPPEKSRPRKREFHSAIWPVLLGPISPLPRLSSAQAPMRARRSDGFAVRAGHLHRLPTGPLRTSSTGSNEFPTTAHRYQRRQT
jgi:hypothetical protein